MKIIDNTLIRIWELSNKDFKSNISKIKELAKSLCQVGCDYIQINPQIYRLLNPLPINIKFHMKSYNEINIKCTNNLEYILSKKKLVMDTKNLTIRGLDDLLLYNYEEKLTLIKSVLGKEINMYIGNEYGCGTALTLEWIRIGGESVITSFNGIGGDTPSEEVICSLKVLYTEKESSKTEILPKVTKLFEEITKTTIKKNKPIIGKDIFAVESGVHVDGIKKEPKNFEPYEPYIVGQKREIVIGKFSGVSSIELKLKELGIKCDRVDLYSILEKVKCKSFKKKRSLTNSELINIWREYFNGKNI